MLKILPSSILHIGLNKLQQVENQERSDLGAQVYSPSIRANHNVFDVCKMQPTIDTTTASDAKLTVGA